VSRSDRASERRLQAYSRGLDAAQKAIHATADNEDGRALAVLNALSYDDSLATSACLLGCLRMMATVFAGGNPSEAHRLLHAAADGLTDDGAITAAEVIVADALNRLTGD